MGRENLISLTMLSLLAALAFSLALPAISIAHQVPPHFSLVTADFDQEEPGMDWAEVSKVCIHTS